MESNKNDYFVNLPLKYIVEQPELFEFLIENKLQPEIGLEGLYNYNFSEDQILKIKQRLDDNHLCCTVHLPFLDLKPSSLNPLIREASVQTLKKSFDIAKLFQPKRMVLHPSFTSWLETPLLEQSYDFCASSIKTLLKSWPNHPTLCFENTYEYDPQPLLALIDRLTGQNVGICFDIGHWYSFSKGFEKNDFEAWFNSFAPYLKHLHLHDNNGDKDAHLALGKGKIDWDMVIEHLKKLKTKPTITLEPHDKQTFEQSIIFFQTKILPFI